jgi:hypothetical protein
MSKRLRVSKSPESSNLGKGSEVESSRFVLEQLRQPVVAGVWDVGRLW